MINLTDYQKELMKCTISEPRRNWFGTSLGSKDSNEFEKLVAEGLAIKIKAPTQSGHNVIYLLTKKGRAAL